jgi:hypothetical protein
MDTKELCLSLAAAVTENQVTKIIDANPITKRKENWRRYGAINNIGTVTGQSPKPVPSLVEKITNSIDALLIKACREHGDDPESPTGPRNMEDALQKYYRLNDEIYSGYSDEKRRKLAANIQVIAEGTRTDPTIVIYDNGEGQKPQDFPNTIVSIGKENKRKIHFVQGKYNMGGTAVLPFCGENRYQLVISRKNLKDDLRNPYGFTLVRRNRGDADDKISWYEYCVDADGKIFEFVSKPLDLGLYDTLFYSGTYLKLYNYDLRNRSDVTLELWRDLNRYIFKPALPLLLYEKRDFKGHTDTKVMHGNRMRAFIDSRDSVEKIFSMKIRTHGIEFPIEVFVFKAEVLTREFIQDMAVVFSVNGQVQNTLDNRFISQNAKKAYLKGSILVNVDCSKMPRALHEDTFMSSRSDMRDNSFYRDLIEAISKELNDNDYLRDLDERRRKDQVYQNPKDEEFLKNIMGKLLREDKDIEKLLGLEAGILSATMKTITKQIEGTKEKFRGKRYPSYFRFKNLAPGNIKMLPQNGESKIDIETDVEDEYLIRPQDKGQLQVKILKPHVRVGPGPITPGPDDEEVIDVNVVGPNEGNIRLRIKPKKDLPIGTSIPINLELSSPDGPIVLTAQVKIDNPHDKSKENEVKTRKEYSLPAVIEVYKGAIDGDGGAPRKTWNDSNLNWTDLDICKVQDSSKEGTLIDAVYINMEPRELQNYIRTKKINGENIQRVTRSYKTSVYLISLVLYYQLFQRLKVEEDKGHQRNDELNYEPGELVSYAMKGLAKILLHITTNENLLKEIEAIEA